eukprot:scaffold74859_cov17-Prasinocladus_malaysianus.AAC.1
MAFCSQGQHTRIATLPDLTFRHGLSLIAFTRAQTFRSARIMPPNDNNTKPYTINVSTESQL